MHIKFFHHASQTIILSSLVLITCNAVSVQAKQQTLDFSQIFIFGDSLSDSGNTFTINGGAFPPGPFYFDGRFSNGLNWVDLLADGLNLDPVIFTEFSTLDPIPDDGINFAFGGATTTENIDPVNGTGLGGLGIALGVEQQVDAFISLLDGEAASEEALFIVWVGANDYGLGESILGIPPDPTMIVGSILENITEIANAGAKNILVPNLPDMGIVPLAINAFPLVPTVGELSDLTREHNDLLSQGIVSLSQSSPELKINLLDIDSLFTDFFANPSAFGFTSLTESCTDINPFAPAFPGNFVSCIIGDPNEFLFWDDYHPSAAGHRFIADAAIETLQVPEPTTVLSLMFLGIGNLALLAKKKISTRV